MITIQAKIEPGSEISESFSNAIRIATTLSCCLEFVFNDVTCIAKPNGDAEKGVNAYYSALNTVSLHKYAIS